MNYANSKKGIIFIGKTISKRERRNIPSHILDVRGIPMRSLSKKSKKVIEKSMNERSF